MNVAISNENSVVEVKNLDAMRGVLGLIPKDFDLRDYGLGMIRFHGPVVFKWSMYTLQPWGALLGSISFLRRIVYRVQPHGH
jgi:hypothetical protein